MDATKSPVPIRLAVAVDRARAINLSVTDVLYRAGVGQARSTVYRWLSGKVDPKLTTFETVMEAVEQRLAVEEERIRSAIANV